MKKLKTLVYLEENFQDFEFVGAAAYMQRSQLFELVYTNAKEVNNTVTGQYGFVKIETNPINTLKIKDFDALLVVGGQHCRPLREDQTFLEVAKHFFDNKKLVFAICDAANIFFEKKLFGPETHYTAYPSNNYGPNYSSKPLVFDPKAKLLSAKDPQAAFGFGRAAVKVAKLFLAN